MDRIEPQLGPEPGAPAPPPPPPPKAEPLPRRRWNRRRNPIALFASSVGWTVIVGLLTPLLVLLALRWLPPPTTAFMLQSPTRPVRYEWVSADQIAEPMRRAAVAAEDQKFWTHNGFDMEAIEKAIEHNKRSKRRRGASTISQQTAKNLFLWPGGGYFRKGVEAGFTILIEKLWNKDRILEVYLNIAEFGPGIYGVEAAAQAFFRKPAAKLSPSEAARLAAVLPSPRRYKAASPGPYVLARAGWIQRQMGYGGPPPAEDEPLDPEPEDSTLPDEGEPVFTNAAPLEPELSEPQPVTEDAVIEELPAEPAPQEPGSTEPLPGLEPDPIAPAPPPEPAPVDDSVP